MDTMACYGNGTCEIAALGRPFQLGMLYDCRKDALIPGITLWDKDKLEQNTSVQQRNNTEINVTTSDSIEEKSNLLKISGDLKLSVLGGLVEVGGSAKYFKDRKKSHNQARVTLQYQTTTRFETLTMSHLGHGQMSHRNVFEINIATHVVTAILYGAGAYFVFDRESSSEEERKQVESELNVTCNKLKCLVNVGATVSFNKEGQEKSEVEKLICTFHGDFKLPTNPTSFSDAVKVYKDLPNMLGKNGELAVPLKVWLYPLQALDSNAAKLQRVISNDLIMYSSDIIETLATAEMRCSDLLKDTTAATFPAIAKKVQCLRQKCHHYKLNFMMKLGSVLPAIRGGGEEEIALWDLLDAHENSPFNTKELDQWLTNKEKEVGKVKSYTNQLQKLGAKMDYNLDDLLADLEVKNVVCFSFTSLDNPDSFLAKLSTYLTPSGVPKDCTKSSDTSAENKDWLSTDITKRLREQMKLFSQLKNTSDDTKFIITSKYDKSHPGACIFIYEDGNDDAVPFIPPSKPATPTSASISHDNVKVQVSDPDSSTIEYRVEYREKQNQETEWKSQPLQKNQEAVHLLGLKPGTEYEIRATAVGKLNYAVTSDACSVVTTTAFRPQTQQGVQIRSGCPAVYQLQAKKEVVGNLTRVTVGEKSVNSINKTVVLVGETGAGKSTLINTLVNYAMGVRWEDKVWFEVIEKDDGDESESQTSDVIVYEIFGFEDKTLPYSLTLIDSPGLGDTGGTGRDIMVTERLFDWFQSPDGVHEVNVIGLVMKASDNRLTDRQMYIYNALMSLFAKDMVENCVLLISHSNGFQPAALLKAIEKADIKCAQNSSEPYYFLFDNCQHEERTEATNHIAESAYKISKMGVKAFTGFLEKSQPQSLGETVKILNGRIRLAACVQNLQERIVLIELKQKQTEQYMKALKKCVQKMEENEDFTIEVEEDYKMKKHISELSIWYRFKWWLGIGPTCCTSCEENCHLECHVSLENCKVIRNGHCASCTKKCPLSDHSKTDWIYVTKTIKVQRTKEEMKKKYKNNEAEVKNTSTLLESLEKEKKDLATEMSQLLEEAYTHVIELDQISLNVNSISAHVHLDFLIKKMEERGDREKVEKLKGMRSKQDKKIQIVLQYMFKAVANR